MDLVGAWLRQLLKAGTAAALVPAFLVAALVVVLVGAGGFGGLGSLGQLLSGPQVTPAERLAARDPADRRDVAPVAPADADEPPASDAPVRSSAARAPRPPVAKRTRPRPAIVAQGPRVARPPQPPVVAPPPAPPPPAAARRPTSKERAQVLAEKLKDTVGDVGTAVQRIVDGLAQTLRIVDPPARPAP